jgi:hypothetical protein
MEIAGTTAQLGRRRSCILRPSASFSREEMYVSNCPLASRTIYPPGILSARRAKMRSSGRDCCDAGRYGQSFAYDGINIGIPRCQLAKKDPNYPLTMPVGINEEGGNYDTGIL